MNRHVAEQFGSNLRYCRRRARMSQEELSFRASIHRTAVGMIERGERMPRLDTLVKLAASLEVNAEELLDGLEWSPGATVLGSFRRSEEGKP